MPAIPDKLQKAINGLIFNHAFFAAILLKQRIVEDNSRPTMSVNGVELRFNRAFVESLSHDRLMGTLAHEILHLANKHHARAKGRNHETWNQACDYSINPLVTQSGLVLPDGALFDARFAGQGAEEIYRTLMAEQPQPEPESQDSEDSQESDKQDDKGESEGEGEGDSQESDTEGDTDSDSEGEGDSDSDSNSDSEGESDGQPDSNGQGNGQGEPSDGPGNEPGNESFGEVDESPKPAEVAETETDVMVKQAINQAPSRGQLPGFIERMVQEVLPRVDWREALAQFVSETVNTDQSWSRPNKRFLPRGMVLPSMHNRTIGKGINIIDTSGSITDAEVIKFTSELLSQMQTFEDVGKVAEITNIYVDSEVQGIEILTPFDKPCPKGGGGTDFKPGFVYIEEYQLNPDFVVYMTDGYCNSFPEEPAYPVLWAVIGSYPSFKPPFGQVLLMDINT